MAKKMKNASLNFGHQVLRRKESHATDTPPSRRDAYASRRGERRASRRKGPLTPAILGYKCAAKMERRGRRLTPNPTRLAMSLCITARRAGSVEASVSALGTPPTISQMQQRPAEIGGRGDVRRALD